jgi:IS1 family transposase
MMKSPEPVVDENKYSQLSCPKPSCPLFNQPGQGNIGHRAWSGKNKDIEWLRCGVCKTEFSERRGTLMEKTKLPEETVQRLLKCQRWGVCDEGTADICDVDLKTVRRFQTVAGRRAEEHHQQAVRELDVAGVQLDEMHSKLRRQRAVWVLSALAIGSQFILWVVCGQRSPDNAARLVAQVVARLRCLPLFLTDGWKVYKQALLRVLGRVTRPRRRGSRGRHPKPRLVAPPDLFYGQVVKVRNSAGRLIQVSTRVIFGGPRRFFQQLARRGLGTKIQTAFQERWYATVRGWSAPLRRRSRCLLLSFSRHQARLWLLVDLYNFLIPHRRLRQSGRAATPAMAIGLADHVWSYRDYIWRPIHPDPLARAAIQRRVADLLIPALEVT